jgi:hypothetical protein
MSFSNPKIKNPATKFIEFKGDAGVFQYYDKEKEENIVLPFPIFFVVLDELHAVKGYNKFYKQGVFSNEVRNIKEELLSVRVFKSDIKLVGTWEKIKGEVERIQGHYSKSVYAGMIVKDTPMELVNFQFHGASRAPWFDYKGDKENLGVSITGIVEDSNGNVTFQRPMFKSIKLRDIDRKEATELDRKLQSYLKVYLQQKEEEIVDSGITDVTDVATEIVDQEPQYGVDEAEIHDRLTEIKKNAVQPKDDIEGIDKLPF